MPDSDSGGGDMGGLFSQPSTTSLDDLLGPDTGTNDSLDVPEPATMVRFVPFKVDVSETGEQRNDSALLHGEPAPEPVPAVVQFVPDTNGARLSEVSSSQPAPSGDSSVPVGNLGPAQDGHLSAPDPQMLARLSFPKHEEKEDSARALTPLVRTPGPDLAGEEEQPLTVAPEAPPEPESPADPDPEPPSQVMAEAVSSLPPVIDDEPDEPDEAPATDEPIRSVALEEAEWNAPPPGPPPRPPQSAQVEAVMSSGPLGLSKPHGLSRPMVAPPPSSEPLHPALYLLLILFGVLAILAFAIPLLQ